MKSDGSASRTALMVAAYRGRASEWDDPICEDPWAFQLAGDVGRALAAQMDEHYPHMELWIAVRTAFLDGQIRYWAREHGVAQVVLLGAGFDTRAARLGGLGVRFFEVDHASTQADKRARLAELDGYPIDAATYVSCDFEAGDDFAALLVDAGFDIGRPAVVIWEGVTAYLPADAVEAVARTVATRFHPKSALLFDYLSKRLADADQVRERDRRVLDEVDRLGEPIRWGTNNPLPVLFGVGFRHVRTVSFEEACLTLTGTYERAREFRFQGIALARVQPPAGS